ncbi:MAG: helix-hairpin-helix domain-containing protein [Firmicutes bacterium]|nr:helix-hairpin-helix domain-containing protein [Bacillota bacterium]
MPRLGKSYLLILAIIIALSFAGGMLVNERRHTLERTSAELLSMMQNDVPIISEPAEEIRVLQVEEKAMLAVHVKGAVEKPGLYILPVGSRVADALNLAVLLPIANTDIINLATLLNDSAEVVVPFRLDDEPTDWDALAKSAAGSLSVATPGAGEQSEAASSSIAILININTANLAALQSLSGIGPAKAQAIIDYRTQHGSFTKIEDIKKVSGIGQATYDKIKDQIGVE